MQAIGLVYAFLQIRSWDFSKGILFIFLKMSTCLHKVFNAVGIGSPDKTWLTALTFASASVDVLWANREPENCLLLCDWLLGTCVYCFGVYTSSPKWKEGKKPRARDVKQSISKLYLEGLGDTLTSLTHRDPCRASSSKKAVPDSTNFLNRGLLTRLILP